MRRRVAVALMVPEPWRTEIDGLRRAAGDKRLERIAPHVTLVPPVNLPAERVDAASDHVRTAAAGASPVRLVLGPPATFAPATPVVYLAVDGGPELGVLRAALVRWDWERVDPRPYVPHATITANAGGPARIESLCEALSDYRCTVDVGGVDLLEHTDRWRSIGRFALAAPAVVGRGGLPVAVEEVAGDDGRFEVIVRQDGAVVGEVSGRVDGERVVLWRLRATDGGVDVVRHLVAAAIDLAHRHEATELVALDDGDLAARLADHGFTTDGGVVERRLR